MKFAIVSILFIAFMALVFNKWITIAEFRYNRDYIAKNLCENRNRPLMHCSGKCQLMKRMTSDEKENAPATAYKFSGETLLFMETDDLFKVKKQEKGKLIIPQNINSHLSGHSISVDHPPII